MVDHKSMHERKTWLNALNEVEVRNYIPQKITYPCSDLRQTMLVKTGHVMRLRIL